VGKTNTKKIKTPRDQTHPNVNATWLKPPGKADLDKKKARGHRSPTTGTEGKIGGRISDSEGTVWATSSHEQGNRGEGRPI